MVDLSVTRARSNGGREHDLSYFDERVHFPDFRVEYELDGRDHHQDVEVVTDVSTERSGELFFKTQPFSCSGQR
jgi:hypothetical protein